MVMRHGGEAGGGLQREGTYYMTLFGDTDYSSWPKPGIQRQANSLQKLYNKVWDKELIFIVAGGLNLHRNTDLLQIKFSPQGVNVKTPYTAERPPPPRAMLEIKGGYLFGGLSPPQPADHCPR